MTRRSTLLGQMIKWIELPGRTRFGFATTPDGRQIYVSETAFSNRDQITRVRAGTKIEFQLRAPKTDQRRFLDALNAGAFRDVPNMNHRNPRCLEIEEQRPRAINVRIVEGHRRGMGASVNLAHQSESG
jgi:hypothetical protein